MMTRLLATLLCAASVVVAQPEFKNEDFLGLLLESTATSLERAQKLVAERDPEDLIPVVVQAIERDPDFQEGDGRRAAFWTLFSIGDTGPSGLLLFTHPEQARLLLQVIREGDRAGSAMALRRVHLLAEPYHAEAVATLRPLLSSPNPGAVMDAASALGRLGEAAEPALPELERLLLAPEAANPECWRQVTRPTPEGVESMPEAWREEYIEKWDGGAQARVDLLTAIADARVRIDPEALAADLDAYDESSLLRRVGVRVIYSHTFPDGRLLDAGEATLRRAGRFVSRVARDTSHERDRDWAVRTIERVLRSAAASDTVKAHWREEALRAAAATDHHQARRSLLRAVTLNP